MVFPGGPFDHQLAPTIPSSSTSGKRKRGRPRKYEALEKALGVKNSSANSSALTIVERSKDISNSAAAAAVIDGSSMGAASRAHLETLASVFGLLITLAKSILNLDMKTNNVGVALMKQGSGEMDNNKNNNNMVVELHVHEGDFSLLRNTTVGGSFYDKSLPCFGCGIGWFS
ncbi:hypothetical protein ACFE04_022977 [Oxalis oulophora]